MDRTPPRNREGSGSSFVQYRPQKSLGMLIERFFASLMLKTQSLILGDWHDMVDDNGIVFDDNVVHQ